MSIERITNEEYLKEKLDIANCKIKRLEATLQTQHGNEQTLEQICKTKEEYYEAIGAPATQTQQGNPVYGEWQLCPKCNGGGSKQSMNFSNQIPSYLDRCDMCNGEGKIIKPIILNDDKTEMIINPITPRITAMEQEIQRLKELLEKEVKRDVSQNYLVYDNESREQAKELANEAWQQFKQANNID